MDNIRSAWQRAIAHCKAAEIRKAFHPLGRLYEIQCWNQEGKAAFTQAAESLHTEEPTGEKGIAYGAALYGQAKFSREPDDRERQAQLFLKSQSILRKLNAPKELAQVNLYVAYFGIPESESEAERLVQESLAIFQELGISWGIPWALAIQGVVAMRQGAYREAEQCFCRALQTYKDLDNRANVCMVLAMLGSTARLQGEHVKARQFHKESLSIARENDLQKHKRGQLVALGDIATALGQFGEARVRYRQALAQWKDIGSYWRMASVLDRLGHVALATRSYSEARQTYREALELAADRRDIGSALLLLPGVATLLAHAEHRDRGSGALPVEQAVQVATVVSFHPKATAEAKDKADGLLNELGTRLSANAFSAAQAHGRAMDLWATVDELLTELQDQS
jgi:tetratricopeptide (TPR) repeat protein